MAHSTVRCAKFIPRKQWIVCGADDMCLRVYNYNTGDLIKKWEAHADYLRSVAVHPTLSLLLSSSDDMSIKLWDWDKDWSLSRLYEVRVAPIRMYSTLIPCRDTRTMSWAWPSTPRTPTPSPQPRLTRLSKFGASVRPTLTETRVVMR